jgi:pimeloyl-ACP methyl ester carboxylesterase
MSRVFALLVGINDYPGAIGKLQGCLNDIDNVHDYLKGSFADPAIVVLKDADATRANVIGQFREHLGKARNGDVAMFHYCGHGARSKAAPEFHAFDLDDRDQGLVCIDSRISDLTFDLADKELALLLAELAPNDAHVAMIFDCCNSGSGTRDLENAARPDVRTTTGRFPPRPLETYLEGQYVTLHKAEEGLSIPLAKHILVAACDRSQTAKEDLDDHRGIFTTGLYDVMRRSGAGLTYADAFIRTRARVRQYVRDKGKTPQDPQFETIAGFDANSGVLGQSGRKGRRTYAIAYADDRWTVECGAIQGMPTDPARPVTLAVHPELDDETLLGTARTTRVGAQTSEILLDFPADPATRYVADVTSVPETPTLVAFQGPADVRDQIAAALAADPAVNVTLDEAGADDGFILSVQDGALRLTQGDTGRLVKAVGLDKGPAIWAPSMLAALSHVAQWRRSLLLANPRPRLDPDQIDFIFAERVGEGEEHVHPGPDLTVEVREVDGAWTDARGQLRIRNRTGQLLHFVLIHFSDGYGVRVITNDQLVASDDFMTILLPGKTPSPDVYFSIDDGRDQGIEQLKLIVSTERVDDFLIELEPLTDERGFGSAADRQDQAKPVTNDWFTKDLRVKIVRRLDQIGASPVSLAGGQITIEPHPTVSANVALSTAIGAVRGGGDDLALASALRPAGLTLASLAGVRGDNPNVLELTDISDGAALAQAPIRIRIDVPLAEGETIVPLVFDGRHIVLAGDTWCDADGATQISIDHVPQAIIDRRSIGGALKMYFFKTYLQIDAVNKLRRVEYGDDGSISYRSEEIADRVATAKNVLLVVHGIIGDTSAMLAGLRAARLDARFDLVLSYDYENLATPIDATARQLRDDLVRVGLTGGGGPSVTIIAHSMGGLVSRWFIEREGGAGLVDHLVMCGTPNGGSPFGQIEKARKILMMLATIGANYVPQLCGPALMLLSRSKKLTPTLEQMAPASSFMAELNASPDPGVRYTILAGDVDKYSEPKDQFFGDLLVKAGRGPIFDALFGNGPNDIAVGVSSIFGEAGSLSKATRSNVACHHLNYFSAEVGRQALTAVAWTA